MSTKWGQPHHPAGRHSTGLPVRKPTPKRYEASTPGELVHVDIKKQGRIPEGGGWKVHGRGSAQDRKAGVARDNAARAGAAGSRNYRYLHHAVDDHSGHTLSPKRSARAWRRWTKPYRPQTNGKVERFNGTLAADWAYAARYASEDERTAAYQTWLHYYNHHSTHTRIGGAVPSERVHNVAGIHLICSRPLSRAG